MNFNKRVTIDLFVKMNNNYFNFFNEMHINKNKIALKQLSAIIKIRNGHIIIFLNNANYDTGITAAKNGS